MAKKRKSRKQTQPQSPAAGVAGEPGWQPVPGVRLRMTLRGHKRVVFRIAWSPDGRRLASAVFDKTVLWNAETGLNLGTLEGHSSWVSSLAWWPEVGVPRMVSASDDKTVRIWDADTGEATNVLEGHTHRVNWAAF